MNKIILIILSIICVKNSYTQDLLILANSNYEKEEYEKSITLYDSLLSLGYNNYELYYNLGNCYYKKREWANAIWHYEKSLKIKKDERIIQNIVLTKLMIIDKIESIPQLFYKRWWINIYSLFSTKSWQIISISCIWIYFLLIILSSFININFPIFNKSILLIAFLSAIFAYSSFYNTILQKEGIMFSPSTVVYSAPTDNSTNLFSLHPGTKIKIIDRIGDWTNLKLSNGNSGWVKHTTFREL